MSTTRAARVLLVQDVPASIAYQRELFERTAAAHDLDLEIDGFDLDRPIQHLLDSLQQAGQPAFYDWMVTDLLAPNEELNDSSGLRLLWALHDARLLGGYRAPSPSPRGIRCVAVCSVCVDHGHTDLPDLAAQFDQLGVRSEWLARGGDAADLVERICVSVRGELTA
ncbi:MAG: hypothetical protein H6837_09000 [Planctomycetes bacterium]|nr:hypothetical protein [Planctomycetota bacterium]